MNNTEIPQHVGAGDTLRLTDLPPGTIAEVVEVHPASPVAKRLLDLGFTPRTRVLAVQRAPLGDPILYELRGMRLCLRRSEARWIRIQRV